MPKLEEAENEHWRTCEAESVELDIVYQKVKQGCHALVGGHSGLSSRTNFRPDIINRI